MSAEVPVTGQVLVREGVFRLRVPDGWAATGLEGHRYRLRCADIDASIDVSVHRGESTAPDARATVRAFARSAGADEPALVPLHGDDEATASRAGARWADGDGWRVVAALSHGRDVVLAAGVAGDEDARSAVERIVTTLEPHARERRWWRRG